MTIELADRDEPPLAPAAPAVTATDGSSTSLDVTWEAPANAGRPPIEAYDLSYRVGGAGPWSDGPQGFTDTGATLGELDADTAYQVRVRARNDEGTGPYSDRGTGRTNPPPKPAVRFDRDAYTAVEGAGATVTVRMEPAPSSEVRVPLRVTERNGATSADYSGVPESLTFAAGETSASFTVRATRDDDEDEAESVLIEFGELPEGILQGSPAATTVSLVATEVTVWYLSFAQAEYTAVEGGAGRAGLGAAERAVEAQAQRDADGAAGGDRARGRGRGRLVGGARQREFPAGRDRGLVHGDGRRRRPGRRRGERGAGLRALRDRGPGAGPARAVARGWCACSTTTGSGR